MHSGRVTRGTLLAGPGLGQLGPYLRGHRMSLLSVSGLALVGSGASLLQPLLVRRVLSAVQRPHGAPAGPVVLLVVVVVGAALLGGLERYLLQRTAEGVVLATRGRLAGRLLRLTITEHDRHRTGDLLSRVGADTTLLRAVVTSGLVEAVSSVVIVVGAAVAMALIDPLLLAVTLASVCVGLGLVLSVSRRVRVLSAQAQAQDRVGQLTSAVERALSAVRTIRASGAEARETTGVLRSVTAAYDAGLQIARLQALVAPAGSIAIQGSFLLVLGLGGARVSTGAITVGDLVAFVLYLFLLVMPLGQALQSWTTLQTGLGALGRIEEVLQLPTEVDDGTQALEPSAALQFEDADFAYADGAPVLPGVSFTVPPGTRTALVGPPGPASPLFWRWSNGSMTSPAVLCASAASTSGTCRGRCCAASWVTSSRRAQRSQVPCVRTCCWPRRTPTSSSCRTSWTPSTCASSSSGHRRGWTARSVTAGSCCQAVSGSDWQSPGHCWPLLLLDEPTSNLDARNEGLLRAAVDAVAADRTLLVVAHRLSTVVDAEQIVVLDGGRVVAVGRHHDLLDTSPLYRELASGQLLVP